MQGRLRSGAYTPWQCIQAISHTVSSAVAAETEFSDIESELEPMKLQIISAWFFESSHNNLDIYAIYAQFVDLQLKTNFRYLFNYLFFQLFFSFIHFKILFIMDVGIAMCCIILSSNLWVVFPIVSLALTHIITLVFNIAFLNVLNVVQFHF